MYNIVICDDNLRSLYNLENYFREFLSEDRVSFMYYESGVELVEKMNSADAIDLVIIDIIMDDMDGYETAERFRKSFPSVLLVFYTGDPTPNPRSFKVTPFRYLIKGTPSAEMKQEIAEIVEELKRRKPPVEIIGRHYKSYRRFQPFEILYFENDQSGSIIHFISDKNDIKTITEKKINELEPILHDFGFRIIHIRYMVNMNYIKQFDSKGQIVLEDGSILSVSRANLKSFREDFANYISEKYK